MELPKTPVELLTHMLRRNPEIEDPLQLTHDQLIARLALRAFVRDYCSLYKRGGLDVPV